MISALFPGLKGYGRKLGWEMLSVAVQEKPGEPTKYVLDHKLLTDSSVRKEVSIPEELFINALAHDEYQALVEFYRNALKESP